MRRVLPGLFAALLLIPLSACDSGGAGEDVNNEFTLTIEPTSSSTSSAALDASQDEINGFSFFFDAENPETGEQAFGIYLNDAESFSKRDATQGLFGFIARSSSRPEAGTYSFTSGEGGIGTSQFTGFLYEDFTNVQSEPFYVIESGTLTLDASSSSRVSGSIDATGTEYIFTGSAYEQQTVQITGHFTAEDVETFVPFNTPGL